jgi:hypothetical protein
MSFFVYLLCLKTVQFRIIGIDRRTQIFMINGAELMHYDAEIATLLSRESSC